MAFRRKNRRKKNRYALIDGDALVFQAVTNTLHLVETQTENDEWYEILNAREAKEEFKTRITELLGVLNCKPDALIFAFGGKGYFRKKIEPSYKSKRSNRKPLGYWSFVEWVGEEWDVLSRPGLEGDDVLGVMHTVPAHWPKGTETVVVSNDKDMRTIPGLLFNPNSGDPVEMITPEMALRSLFVQSIAGDPTDGFAGVKGVGAIGANKLADNGFEGATTIDELFAPVIVPAYEAAGQTEADALRNCRLARILSASDISIDNETGVWTHELWTPATVQPANARTSRGRTRGRRVARVPVHPVSRRAKR